MMMMDLLEPVMMMMMMMMTTTGHMPGVVVNMFQWWVHQWCFWLLDDFCDEYSDDIKDNHDYGSDINSDSDTYEYSEIANRYEDKQFENSDDGHDCIKGSKYHGCSGKYVINDYKMLGGQNVLHSLSSAQNLELLGHSGEVHYIP